MRRTNLNGPAHASGWSTPGAGPGSSYSTEGPAALNRSERNRLIESNLPLVGHLVNEVCARATHLPREDLAGVGALALTKAADSFDPGLGVPFGAFARIRIKGALQDEMRAMDWAGTRTRSRISETTSARERLTESLGRMPTDEEVAAAMGTDVKTVSKYLGYAARRLTSMNAHPLSLPPDGGLNPEERIVLAERVHFIRQGVQALPEQLRQVIVEHFFQGRTVGDIAKEAGLTHGAISHRKSQALALLREGIHTHYEGTAASGTTARRHADYLTELGEATTGGFTRANAPVLVDSTAA